MNRSGKTGERLLCLFLLAALLFNPPLLSIFDTPAFVEGFPLLYIYLFVAWAVLVLLMALTIESAAAVEDAEARDSQRPPAEGDS